MTQEHYGDLSDKEFYALLDEIRDEDTDITQEEDNSSAAIIDKEAFDEEEYYSKYTWIGNELNSSVGICLRQTSDSKSAQKSRERAKRQKEEKERRKTDIQRMALNQDEIILQAVIPKEQIQNLIRALTQEHTDMAKKYSDYINKRLATLLNPLIPRRLRDCFALFPWAVKKAPGFMYQGTDQLGGSLKFWACPNVPFFFAQGTEQEALKKNAAPQYLFSLDKAVANYFRHTNAKHDKEVHYVSCLVMNKIKTYFELLQYNPFWFEIIYKNETKKP